MPSDGSRNGGYHGYLDRFSVIGHCIVAEGWANHRDLALWYRDELLTINVGRINRSDLVGHFGPDAAAWGFSLAATLPEKIIDRTKFRLRFNAEMTIDPTEAFSRFDDQKFLAMVAKFRESVLSGSSMLEIGSRARSGATYRNWFPTDIDYVGLDVAEGPNVDVVADAHHMSRSLNRRFNHMFSMAVFEHILMPWKVALEMNKMMSDGGTALIISHGAWPLHEQPWDFFRFSTESWRGIFNLHTGFRLLDAQYQYGASVVPHYISSNHEAEMSLGEVYLLSGCVAQRIGDAKVSWDAEASEIYEMQYSHG
jgi:hypothetical protein